MKVNPAPQRMPLEHKPHAGLRVWLDDHPLALAALKLLMGEVTVVELVRLVHRRSRR